MTMSAELIELAPRAAVPAVDADLSALDDLVRLDPVEEAAARVRACEYALERADSALQSLAGGAVRLDISAREMSIRTSTAIAQMRALQKRRSELRADLAVAERIARR